MTRQDIISAFEMKMDGYTYQNIADKYGVTKQYIQQTFSSIVNRCTKPFVCVYPHISDWMFGAGITPFRLANILSDSEVTSPNSIKLKLAGKRDFTMQEMIKLVTLTHLPLEVLFESERGDKE